MSENTKVEQYKQTRYYRLHTKLSHNIMYALARFAHGGIFHQDVECDEMLQKMYPFHENWISEIALPQTAIPPFAWRASPLDVDIQSMSHEGAQPPIKYRHPLQKYFIKKYMQRFHDVLVRKSMFRLHETYPRIINEPIGKFLLPNVNQLQEWIDSAEKNYDSILTDKLKDSEEFSAIRDKHQKESE